MKILSIETSCDETAISIVEAQGEASGANFNVLANITLSQAKLHAEYGGVFPNLAKREHSKNLVPVLKQALENADMLKIAPQGRTFSRRSAPPQGPTFPAILTTLEREPQMLAQFLELIPTIEKPEIDVIGVTNGPGLEPALWVGVNFAKALSLVWNIPVIPINHMEGHIFAALLQKIKDGKIKIGS
ncbi:N(6)-L-threonylcarbamoyladenine synthase, partial [hydrothermal vent metagenome]